VWNKGWVKNRNMFEREIKFIYDFNLNKINHIGPYFTFEQLSTTDIHPAILHYISAEIDFLVFEDRQKLLKNSVFDYSGEKISYSFIQITEELKKTKRFSQEYIAKLILHASSFTINYLIRPKWTLSKFVFDESNHKSTNEIKQILNYIFYYKYLIKIITSYINTKKILSMNVEEFEALLNKADKLGVESYLPNIMSTSLKSMAEFFNIGEVKKFNIPLMAVELFLEEKELFKHLDILNKTFGDDENAKFNIYDLQRILSSVMFEKSETPPNIKETTQFEIVPVENDLPEEKLIKMESDKIIEEPITEQEELEVPEYVTNQKNDIPEEESEEELIRQKYVIKNDLNDDIENEEELSLEENEVRSLGENTNENINEEENDTPEDETGILKLNYSNEEKSDQIHYDNIITEEDENVLKNDQDLEKQIISEPIANPIIEKTSEIENYELNELRDQVEGDSKEDLVSDNDEKLETKIEEISSSEEEIRIKLNTKFRIHVNEDNRIEPVQEEPKININEVDTRLFEEEPENLLDKFSGGNSANYDEKEFSNIEEKDEIESSNIEETGELLNIFTQEPELPDLKNDDTEEIITEPDKIEEYENVITTEKKDTFEVENKPEDEKPEEITPDPEDGFFDLTIPVNLNIIEDDIPESKKILIFGDDGLEDKTIVEKELQKKPEESVEEDIIDNSNFKDIFNKEIKVFEEDEINSLPPIPEKKSRKIDITEILEHKDMTKIINVIFDYDIEDFANTIEEIANCKNVNEANILLKDILAERRINRHSKEIDAFRSIIRELFN
jgi:hypothetical protein